MEVPTHGDGQDPVVIFGHLASWKLPSRWPWLSANNRIFDPVLSDRSLIYIITVFGLGPNPEGPQMSQALFQTFRFQ